MKRWGLLLKLFVSIFSFYLLAHTIEWEQVLHVFGNIQLGWMLLALIIFLAAQVVSSLRCAYIVRTLGGQLDLKTSVRAHFVGLWFNQILPTSLGGDVIKIAILRKYIGIGYAIRSSVLDRMSGLVFMMFILLLTLPLYSRVFPNPVYIEIIAIIASCFLLLLSIGVWMGKSLAPRFAHLPLLHKPMLLLADVWEFRGIMPLWQQFWTSAIVHFNGIIAYSLISLAFGLNVNFLSYVLITPLVFIIALMPISLAGWGVREMGAVWLFGQVGIPNHSAMAVSIAFGLLLIISSIPGIIFLIQPKLLVAE